MNRLAYRWNSIGKKAEVCGVKNTCYSSLDYRLEKIHFNHKHTCAHCQTKLELSFCEFSPTIFDVRIDRLESSEDYNEAGFYCCHKCYRNEFKNIMKAYPGESEVVVNYIIKEAIEKISNRWPLLH